MVRVAQEDLRNLPISLDPPRPLLDHAWELRAKFGAADALYAALQALGAALLASSRVSRESVTTDRPLARALEAQTALVVIAP